MNENRNSPQSARTFELRRFGLLVLVVAAVHFSLSIGTELVGAGVLLDIDSPGEYQTSPLRQFFLDIAAVLVKPFAPLPEQPTLGAMWRLVALNSAFWGLVIAVAIRVVLRFGRKRAVAGLCLVAFVPLAWSQDQRESTVGFPARITDLVLPGTELEAAPSTAKTPVVLRITAVSPHGTAFRYDLEYSGLDPGEYDLRAFLKRKDGSSTDELPPIPVSVRSVLGPGQVKPHAPVEGGVPSFGGYRPLLIAGGVVWVVGLIVLLRAGRKRRREALVAARPPRTLAERLRPLVERAGKGELSRAERSQLELSLLAYWRRKLELEDRRPSEALELLREHADAGPLLRKLEEWLHAPGTVVEPAEVARLLEPYSQLPADLLDEEVPELEAAGAELGRSR
jgi:hypothetical protein